jgi:hypothetical protein
MTQPVPPQQFPPPEPGPAVPLTVAAAELSIAAMVFGIYTAWLVTVTALVLAPFVSFGLSPDPSAIWSTTPQWNRDVDRLLTALEQLARAGWEDAARQLGVNLPFDKSDPLLHDALQRTRNLMVRTPDEVYKQVIKELGKGHNLGETPDQLAARVRRVLDVNGAENWPARAQTVAVTEVHRAFNFGGLAASQRIQQREQRPLTKRWDSKDDAAVRPAHRRADGQLRPVSQPFLVMGEPLMMPGDPAGMPANVINCRCKAIFGRQ